MKPESAFPELSVGEEFLDVVVRDVRPLSGPLDFEGTPSVSSLEDVSLLDIGRRSVNRWSRWTLIDRNLESDVGEWFLIRHDADKAHLILFGEWDFERDWVYMACSEVELGELGPACS